MHKEIKLSVIMPCYNVASTLKRALDSVLMQNVSFEYEIIVVDDGSQDETIDILNQYANQYKHIRIIQNETNLGNAMTFYNGLSAAQGDYFCVLDGDDYYTINDKYQRQVAFLDRDIDQEYVAAAHRFLIDLGDGKIHIPDLTAVQEFSYVDLLTQHSGYYHTSAYMYRNIFRGNVLEYFKDRIYRGDTPRTTFHLMYSNKKVKVLNFVGSAYYFSNEGIWTSMNHKAQFEYQVNYFNHLKEIADSSFEHRAIDKLIEFNTKKAEKASGENKRKYLSADVDSFLIRIRNYCWKYAFSEREFTFGSIYYSEYLDNLCASLGYLYRIHHPESAQTMVDQDSVAIVISSLNPNGGGIFREITEIVEMYSDKKIFILITQSHTISEDVLRIFKQYTNTTIICTPPDRKDKLTFLHEAFRDAAPAKAYFYASHADAYGQALMQSGPCKNITLFSFDHGFVCGISNPNIHCIIAKRPSDYAMLSKKLGNKVIYIPTWNKAVQNCGSLCYQPFYGHDKLVTACGAARFYKLEGNQPFNYIDMVLDLLSRTGGTHFHFGPIPEENIDYIRAGLKERGLKEDAFRHIEWADNLSLAVLENHIDIFIEPFPIVSYKLTLSMLSCGIPVFAFRGIKRMETIDFIYPGNLLWKTREEFVEKLAALDEYTLKHHSECSINYFLSTHSIDVIKPYFIDEKEYCRPKYVYVTDNYLPDISDYLRMFGDSGKINLMKPEQDAEKLAEEKRQAESRLAEEKRKATERLKHDREIAADEIKKVKTSYTYRVGHMIVWLPRKTNIFINEWQKNGFSQAFKAIKGYDETQKDPIAELRSLNKSWTMRIGHAVMRGPRLVKRIIKKKNTRTENLPNVQRTDSAEK